MTAHGKETSSQAGPQQQRGSFVHPSGKRTDQAAHIPPGSPRRVQHDYFFTATAIFQVNSGKYALLHLQSTLNIQSFFVNDIKMQQNLPVVAACLMQVLPSIPAG